MKLSNWLDQEQTEKRLVAASMRQAPAELAARHFVEAASALQALGVERATDIVACWAPGRIEVLGKHTDYCGGHSVLAAAERGFAMIAARRDDRIVRLIDAPRMESAEFQLAASLESQSGHWTNYSRTVARRLAKNFPNATRGATIAFSSNLPASAGMSSSSALVVGTFMLLATINDLTTQPLFQSWIDNREKLAGYLGTVENGSSFGPLQGDSGVGTFGGSEDHTAILCGQPEALVQYSFCPVHYQRAISIANRYIFTIASSGVVAEKTGAAQEQYNRLTLLAKAIADHWQGATDGPESSLAAILASSPDASDRLRRILRDSKPGTFTLRQLIERLDHFEVEDRLIKMLPPALDPATIRDFGSIVRQSQNAAERLLKNATPETTRLVNLATQLGAHAASAFGAGFGGSVWALIDVESESTFLARWRNRYLAEFPNLESKVAFFAMRPGPPALIWAGEGLLA